MSTDRQRSFASTAVLLVALLSLSALPLLAQPASPDLTGTWQGGYTCNWLWEGEPGVDAVENTLEISHISDTEVRMRTVAASELIYNGYAVGMVNQPEKGGVTFVGCGTQATDWEFNEIVSARFDTTDGSFHGKSTFHERLFLVGGFCDWVYTRIDTADPLVQACAVE